MRIANVDGRLVLLTADGQRGPRRREGQRRPVRPGPAGRLRATGTSSAPGPSHRRRPARRRRLRPGRARRARRPAPRQVFAIGLNYSRARGRVRLRASRSRPADLHQVRVAASTGPDSDGRAARRRQHRLGGRARRGHRPHAPRTSPRPTPGHYVAGLTVGQDISERITQLAGPAPQFSLGKSFPGFAPIGPWLVTPDEFPTPTTSSSAARSTARPCRTAAPAT